MSITIYDGPPGVGKTSQIVREAPLLPGRTAIVTYTKEAAATVLSRAPALTAGTVYSLSWPLVRRFGKASKFQMASSAYQRRPARNEHDSALDEYIEKAPSRFARRRQDDLAELLHAWNGTGAPPFGVHETLASGALAYIMPIARWFASGCPGLTEAARFDTVYVDEAQDMGTLEMAMAMALVAPGGRLLCYGDPGQALYAGQKGLRGGLLPAAWRLAGEQRTITGGHRCGDPLASAAARVLRPIWDRPASTFCAPHETRIVEWWPRGGDRYTKGDLILGYSRADCRRHIEAMGLRSVALTPSIRERAKVTVCTGHSAKGAQADDVYVLPWSENALERLDEQEPGTIRLFYTMLTRAKRQVFVPSTLLARMGL